MKQRHTITINHEVYLRLKRTGFFNETYNDVISRLVDFADKNKQSYNKEDDEK